MADGPEIFAADWGTTNLRAYAVGADGAILARVELEKGINAIPREAFAPVFQAVLGTWLTASPETPVLICGMAGSRQGWIETPYAPCPARLGDVAALAVKADVPHPGGIFLLPGLSTRDAHGAPDVMRGEETQIFGAAAKAGDGFYCLPGTHSKWARVHEGRIEGFITYMTGEFYGLLARMSLLSRTMGDGDFDGDAFAAGVKDGRAGAPLLHQSFTVRARGLVDAWSGEAQRDYLSGLLIGAEIGTALPEGVAEITVIASSGLTSLYHDALSQTGAAVRAIDGAEAVVKGALGLWRCYAGEAA